MEISFKDHYIGFPGHPKFIVNKLIEDEAIRVVVQKYEMIIFTNKGDVLGDPDFGCDLIKLLFETRISSAAVKRTIIDQINKYIPEISGTSYSLDVQFVENPNKHQEIMIIEFQIAEYEVSAIIS